MVTSEFAEHVFDRVVAAFRNIEPAVRADAYVASLFVYDERDDPRFPTVTPDYNTESHVEAQQRRWGTDPNEARWNYARWDQAHLALIAHSEFDPDGARLRERWVKEQLQMWYEDDAVEFDPRGEPITQAFVDLLVEVVQRLHRDGVVTQIFGRVLPVLIYELEYYDAIAEQNLRANPDGVIPPDFVAFCTGAP